MGLHAIEDFLAREVLDAHYDSSGSFSWDESLFLDKLGKYQSDCPGLWLVKLLQAAVALDAEQLNVKQRRGLTTVSFRPDLPVDWADWCRGEYSSQSGLGHLQVGLRAATTLPDCEFTLRCGRALEWRIARGARCLPEPKCPPEGQIQITRQWNSGWSLTAHVKRARVQVDERLLLQELGRYAPIPIFLDDRLLNDPVINKPPGLRLGIPMPLFASRPNPALPYTCLERLVVSTRPNHHSLALMDHTLRRARYLERGGKLAGDDGDHLFLQQWVVAFDEIYGEYEFRWLHRDGWQDKVREWSPGFCFDSRIERAGGGLWSDYNRDLCAICVDGYLSLDINRGHEGRLYLVKDGVIMKPKSLPEDLAEVLVIWSAPQIRTDLSQLQVLEDEIYQAVWKEVSRHLLAAARSLLSLLELRGMGTQSEREYRERAGRIERYLMSS